MAVGGGLDGAVDCEADMAGPRGEGGARHDAEGSVDGDGHHGEAEFYGEGVGSALEAADGAGEGSRPFGEDDDGHAFVELPLGVGHGGADGGGGGVVDIDLPGYAA